VTTSNPAARLEDLFEITDDETPTSTLEYVPHKGGRVRADKMVVMSVRVTARERYLWSLAVLQRGTTLTDVVRRAFNQLLEEEQRSDG
jgi:hypothetical protein